MGTSNEEKTIEEKTVQTSRLRTRVLTCGAANGQPVLLLHGFPELAESWRDVMPALAANGYFAIAPDLRGYGGTDKPAAGYDIDSLALDVVALLDALGLPRAHVVGHDWGGAVAYHLAARHPDRVERLAVVNCPHPILMARRVWLPPQLFRSSYMLFFQLPLLPEFLLSREGGKLVPRMLRSTAVDKRNFTRERLEPYALNFATPGVASGAVNYYRSMVRTLLSRDGRGMLKSYPRIRAPFRLIWAEADVALGKELTYGMEPYFERPPDIQYLPGVGHFAPIEAPEKVAPLIVEHLRA